MPGLGTPGVLGTSGGVGDTRNAGDTRGCWGHPECWEHDGCWGNQGYWGHQGCRGHQGVLETPVKCWGHQSNAGDTRGCWGHQLGHQGTPAASLPPSHADLHRSNDVGPLLQTCFFPSTFWDPPKGLSLSPAPDSALGSSLEYSHIPAPSSARQEPHAPREMMVLQGRAR